MGYKCMDFKKQDPSLGEKLCRYATLTAGVFATVFMLVAAVLVFACGVKTFNLEPQAVEYGFAPPAKTSAVAGFSAIPGIGPEMFRCYGTFQHNNDTASCALGSAESECGASMDGMIRRCLPSNFEDDKENFDINPDSDEPRFGFTADGSCGTAQSCRSGYADPTTEKCAAFPAKQGPSTHGVCTDMGEMAIKDGAECWGSNQECVNNKCQTIDGVMTCKPQADAEQYDSAALKFKRDMLAADMSTYCSNKITPGTPSMITTRIANGEFCNSQSCVSGSSCENMICRKHMQNLDAGDRDDIKATHNSLDMNKCDNFADYKEASPYLGLAFNFLIMFFVIAKHTFASASWGQRHGGFMIAACIGTMVSIYLVHLTYYERTYDVANQLVSMDCSATDDLDAAYHMNLLLISGGGSCQRYSSEFSHEDLKKHLGVDTHTNPVAEEFAYMVAGFTGSLVLSIWSLVFVVLMQLGNGCIEQTVFSFDATSEGSPKTAEMASVGPQTN